MLNETQSQLPNSILDEMQGIVGRARATLHHIGKWHDFEIANHNHYDVMGKLTWNYTGILLVIQ